MKTSKKILCMVLSLIMAFSSVSVLASAQSNEDPAYTYSFKYHANKSDAHGVGKLLDELDKVLTKADILEEIAITDNIKFVIDLRNINALCGTLDDFADLLDNLLIQAAIAIALGDLKELEFDTWKTGMQRSSKNDVTIVKEIVEFVNANSTVIGGVVDGTLDLGLLNDKVDIGSLLGEDGVSGIIKELLFGLVYDGAALDSAYNQYKNNVDAFVYGPLLEKYAGQYLSGFTMSADTNVEDLICALFNSAFEQYLEPLIRDINVDLASYDIPELQALAPYVNLKGSTYNLDGIALDANKSLMSQLNDLVGKAFSQVVPGYSWTEGDYTVINENIEGAFKYLGTVSGVVENAEEKTFDEIVMEVIAIVLSNIDVGSYDDGVTECTTLEDMVKAVLINWARDLDITYTYGEDDSYLVVLGDIFAVWAYDHFDIRDLDGKAYRGGKGDDIWTALNYFLNYFYFEEGGASFIDLDVSKTDSFFAKLDKVVDLFGATKSKGVDFDSEEFLLGSDEKKGLLDSVFSLDIENIIAITAVPALETAGEVEAVEFVYNTVRYLLNNWTGKQVLPAYVQKTAFTDALSNENISNIVKILLSTLNARKSSVVTIAALVGSLVFKDEDIDLGALKATVDDCYYTGTVIYPTATVTLGDTALVQNQDFVVLPHSYEMGAAKATIKLIGLYEGEAEADFNVVLAPMGDIRVTTTDTKVRLRWDPVPGAESYNVYAGDELVETVAADAELTKQFTGLTPATTYNFKVEAVDEVYGASEAKAASALTNPAKVTGVKVDSVTASSATLSWNAVPGATGYVVERYSSSKKAYVTAGKTAGTSYTVKGLYSYTSYYFRVKAYITADNGTVYSLSADKVSARTKLGQVTGLKASSKTSASVSLTWDKVRNAKGYRVEQYTGGKWVKLANVTANTYNVTGLKASTRYAFRVRAYYSSKVYGAYSSNLWVYTNLPKVTGLKVSTVTSSSAKLSWSKVSGATSYVVYRSTDGKTWKQIKIVTGTSYTATGLYSGKNYWFRVAAYSNKIKSYGDYSSSVKTTTRVGQVDSLKVTARAKTSISLSWAKERGAAGYVVYRSLDGKTWTKVATTTKTSVTATGLVKNKNYQFKVRAYQKLSSGTVYGSYSVVVKAKTKLL